MVRRCALWSFVVVGAVAVDGKCCCCGWWMSLLVLVDCCCWWFFVVFGYNLLLGVECCCLWLFAGIVGGCCMVLFGAGAACLSNRWR